MNIFDVGSRVRIQGHWEFPDGTTGTIAYPPEFMIALSEPGEWMDHRRIHPCRKGLMTSYYVIFDTSTDDGSGDGPYLGGEIDESSLRIVGEEQGGQRYLPPNPIDAEQTSRRSP